MEHLTLHVEGMSCGHCLNAVTRALSALRGVRVGSVKMGRVDLDFDPATQSRDAIVSAIGAAGYRATAGA